MSGGVTNSTDDIQKMKNIQNSSLTFVSPDHDCATSLVKVSKLQTLIPLGLIILTVIGFNIGMRTLLLPSKKPMAVAAKQATAPISTPIGSNMNNARWGLLMPNDTTWGVISGKWIIQEADFVQTRADGHDMTMSYRTKMFSNFALRVNIKHDQGSGGGVLINMPDATLINRAHLIRFTSDGKGLMWGYFDDNPLFVPQGSANVAFPSNNSKKLEVHSTTNFYSIWLDDELIIKDVPLQSHNGYIALTNTTSVVRFNNVELTNLANTVDAANTPKLESH